MPGNGQNQEELTAAVSGAGRTKVEDDLTGGSQLSLTEEGERLTPSRFWPGGPWASFGPGPVWLPGSNFLIFISFLLFLFLFSYFFYTFCKTPSNQIKQNSKCF
jgi:hypothetical protein